MYAVQCYFFVLLNVLCFTQCIVHVFFYSHIDINILCHLWCVRPLSCLHGSELKYACMSLWRVFLCRCNLELLGLMEQLNRSVACMQHFYSLYKSEPIIRNLATDINLHDKSEPGREDTWLNVQSRYALFCYTFVR